MRFPSVIGHEFAGEVVDVGKGVTQFKVSDRIAVDPVVPCRSCVYCRSGKENVCKTGRRLVMSLTVPLQNT